MAVKETVNTVARTSCSTRTGRDLTPSAIRGKGGETSWSHDSRVYTHGLEKACHASNIVIDCLPVTFPPP
jgi:hypothetical protein